MRCQTTNCPNEAECAIALNVPAMHCPIAEHDPLRLVIGIQLCASCAEEEKACPQEWINLPHYRQIFHTAAQGKAPPDFKRAFINRVELDSAEWQLLQKGAKS